MSSARRHPSLPHSLRSTALRTAAALCVLGSSALVLAGCGDTDTRATGTAAAQTTGPATASPSLTDDQAERKDLISRTEVGWDDAVDTAVKEVPGGKLVDLELKATPRDATASPGTDDPTPSTPNPAPSAGAPEWAVRVAAADGTVHHVDIDAVNGKVFRTQLDPDQDADDKRELADRLSRATQTPQQAVQKATDRTDGTVTGIELGENDDQRLIWSIDIVTTDKWDKTTYDVDATNGEILREHVDRD
ncbi:PepSY domain-containing protein [Streptomyces sp. HMX87]|uniref:PepSY domain-containing protein n=1 Tax=Streptomyces sp. HMX87 TaxID=3390849 RepID=UPI003A882258